MRLRGLDARAFLRPTDGAGASLVAEALAGWKAALRPKRSSALMAAGTLKPALLNAPRDAAWRP